MKIDILTLFPEMIESVLATSILGRAQSSGQVDFTVHQLRTWAMDKHKTVDDTPYGGGAGMVLKVNVVDRALLDLKSNIKHQKEVKPLVILLSPQGKPFSQKIANRLAKQSHLILVAGHYEGFDERIRTLVDDEISIGDYVLTGGELPALVVTDAVVRLVPGVLGNETSTEDESFSSNLLEYPQYTRPECFMPTSIKRARSLVVPPILLSGHHRKITEWRTAQARERTRKRRPDLLENNS